MKKYYFALSFIFLAFGLLFIISSSSTITGAVVGTNQSLTFTGVGITLLFISTILFIVAPVPAEIKSSIHKHPGIVRIAEKAAKNQDIQRELDHLVDELHKGNIDAGSRGVQHVSGTDVFYVGGKKGARLYFRKTAQGYEIVGKSSKDRTQDKVMGIIRSEYVH